MSGERILVVDDDLDVVELCRRILTSDGYLVKGATSGQEALEMARREPFDLLLVDVMMPGMDGMEVYRSIRGMAPEVAGVIITAYGSLEVAMEAIRLGFSGFVTKPFSPEALALAVGQALARRRLERENARLRALIPLLELSRALMSTTDLDELLNQVVHVARRETKADRVSLMLLDEASGELTIEAMAGLQQRVVAEVEKGIAGLAMERGEALLLDGEGPLEPRIREAMGGEVSSALCVPLRVKDRIIGVLNLAKLGGPPFTEVDMEMASILCGHAAIAIENARLFEETRQRALQLQTIEEVGRKASSILDLDELLPYAARAIQQSFGYYHVDIFLIDQATGYAVFKASNDPAVGKVWKEQGLRFKVGEEGMVGWVAHTGEPLLANDVSQEPHYLPDELLPETKSELVVPLKVGERVVGVLDVNGDKLNAFDEKDMFILQTLAGQIAIAIENARLYAEVNRLAITDALTGLYNRRWFDIQLDKEFNRATHYGHPLSLAIVEVDHLKKINDTWGHQVGDLVLQTIARVLKANSRQMDVICRYGGDEIAIILPETDKEGALGVGERLRASIEAAPIEGKEGQRIEGVSVTISLGVATYPTDAADKEELIRRADQACYLAKQLGRNRVCSWSECSAAEQG